MENDYKEVYFDQYCKNCKNWHKQYFEDPCYDCLAEPKNLYSHKPINYESKER